MTQKRLAQALARLIMIILAYLLLKWFDAPTYQAIAFSLILVELILIRSAIWENQK